MKCATWPKYEGKICWFDGKVRYFTADEIHGLFEWTDPAQGETRKLLRDMHGIEVSWQTLNELMKWNSNSGQDCGVIMVENGYCNSMWFLLLLLKIHEHSRGISLTYIHTGRHQTESSTCDWLRIAHLSVTLAWPVLQVWAVFPIFTRPCRARRASWIISPLELTPQLQKRWWLEDEFPLVAFGTPYWRWFGMVINQWLAPFVLVQDVDEEMTPEVRSGLLCGSCETMPTLTPSILDVVFTYLWGGWKRSWHHLRCQVNEGSTESSWRNSWKGCNQTSWGNSVSSTQRSSPRRFVEGMMGELLMWRWHTSFHALPTRDKRNVEIASIS